MVFEAEYSEFEQAILWKKEVVQEQHEIIDEQTQPQFVIEDDEEGEEEDTLALGRPETVRWSDNALDVFPGDPQVVEVRGLLGKRAKVRAAYMGCERGRVVYEQ